MKKVLLRMSCLLLLIVVTLTSFACSCNEEPDPLYQFDYTSCNISQYASMDASSYRDITLTLSSDCHYTEDMLQDWVDSVLTSIPVYEYVTTKPITHLDTIRIYYTATADGELLSGHQSTEENPQAPKSVDLRYLDFLNVPGINDHLVGATPGIPVVFSIDTPQNHNIFRGKTVTFAITVVDVLNEVYLSALTADYIKNRLGYQTDLTEESAIIDAFLETAKEQLQEQAQEAFFTDSRRAVLDLLTDAMTIKGYPGQDIAYQYENRYAYYETMRLYENQQQLAATGKANYFPDIESYLRYEFGLGESVDPFPYLDAIAATLAEENMAIALVFHGMQMSISDEAFETRKTEIIDAYVKQNYITREEAENTIDAAFIKNELMWEMVMEFLLSEENCTVYYSAK